jgi:flagella basal body P-ring formation protein FlgA
MKRKDCDKQFNGQYGKRARFSLVMGGFVAVLCYASDANAGNIRIRPGALIDHDHIRLSDVAVIEGFTADQLSEFEDMAITEAPDFGQSKLITLNDIRAKLAGAGVNMAVVCLKGASRCVVRRPAKMPAEQDAPQDGSAHKIEGVQSLRAQIRRFANERLAEYGGEAEVSFRRTPAALLALSGPAYTFEIEPRSNRKLGTFELLVTIQHGSAEAQTQKVAVEVALKKNVIVAISPISRGQTITRADIMTEQRSFKKLEQIGMTKPATVIGQEAKRDIRIGDMIKAGDIKSKILVKRNDLVSIRSVRNGIAIESTGKALADGALGDSIEVRNEGSEETFWAQVTGLRQAEALGRPERRAGVDQSKGRVK